VITLCAGARLHTSHDRLRVSSLKELPMSDGVAFTATLRLDGKRVGVIENDGHGGGPLYLPDPGSRFGYGELNAFAAACRHDNDGVCTEAVLNDLVTEYDLTLRITRATATGATLLRLVTADGYTGSTTRPAAAPTQAAADNDRGDARCHGGDASPPPGRATGTRLVAEIDHGARTVRGVEVRITEQVWNNGGRSFDAHRIATDDADGGHLTADGSFDAPPTDEQIAALLCPHIEPAQAKGPLP
jgi:hypothetical protein